MSQRRATRVYVAGPYSKGDKEANVRRALDAATALLHRGYAPYVPHLSHYWDRYQTHDYETWMRLCLAWVRASDVMLRLAGESNGAVREGILAHDLGVPIYLSLDTLCAAEPPTRVG